MTIKAGRVSGRTSTGFHSRIQNGLCSLWQMQTVSSMQCRQVPAVRCLLQQDGPQTLQASGNLSWPLMQGGAVHQEGGTAEWLHPAGAACKPQQMAGDAGCGLPLEPQRFLCGIKFVRH